MDRPAHYEGDHEVILGVPKNEVGQTNDPGTHKW